MRHHHDLLATRGLLLAILTSAAFLHACAPRPEPREAVPDPSPGTAAAPGATATPAAAAPAPANPLGPDDSGRTSGKAEPAAKAGPPPADHVALLPTLDR